MEFIKRNAKAIIGSLIILILIEFAVVYYLITQFHENYLQGPEALSVAARDAGLPDLTAEDAEIQLKHKSGKAWYNIRFEENGTVYVYEIDAENGDILSSATE